ncbi:helix-turn-helix domain-containing protein [Demetria terragena]|uniref:helix-turn-helix domain-containing protein n=1 Tax=Demetria terragena TaxID=63959 RepID=UPI00037A4EF5|nr:helix-turn-helix domain-containing protein [Demetria terragena]
MKTTFSTAGLSPADAVARFLDKGADAYCPHITNLLTRGHVLDRSAFFVEGTFAPVGESGLTTLEMNAGRLERSRKDILRGDSDIIYIVTPLRGTFSFVQHGNTVTVGPGDLYVEDTRYPFDLYFSTHAKAMGFAVPVELLTQRVGSLGRLSGAVIRQDDRIGTMLVRHLRALAAADTDQLAQNQSWRMQDVALDLAAMAFSQVTATTPTLQAHADTAHTRLVQAMLNQLHRTDASVASVAHEAAMSPRYASALMAETGTTVAQRMRDLRLERARSRLQDPAYDVNKIIDIATSCGFADASTFARRFRESEGLTPTDYRRRAQSERQAAAPQVGVMTNAAKAPNIIHGP